MNKPLSFFYCALLSVCLPGRVVSAENLSSANNGLDEELKFLQAESYVITASKVLELKDRSIATVSLITQEQIRALGAKDLQDVLYTIPGITTTQTPWGAKQITMRGIGSEFSEKVLILLNGHPLDHDITNGGSTDIYDNIALDNVKRIEIVRGPGSLLYGANAFLGTINIITKNADDQTGTAVTAGGGSFGTQQYNVYTASKINDLKVTANANVQATDGISRNFKNTNVSSSLDSEKYDIDLNLAYQNWNFTGHFANKNTGTFAGFNENLQTNAARNYQDYFFILGYKNNLSDKLNIDIKAYHDNFNFDNIIPFASDFYLNTGITNTKTGSEAQLSYQWFDNNQLIVGFKGETQNQFNITHTAGPTPLIQTPVTQPYAIDKDRTLASGFVQDIWDILPNLRFSAGARYDHYSDFGNTFNPRVGFNWEIKEGYILRYSFGTAFRAPTFGETNGTYQALLGNTNLRPETISTNEIGLNLNPIKSISTAFTLFESNITNIIHKDNINGNSSVFVNGGSALSKGIEVEAKYHYLEGSYIGFNFTSQKVNDNVTQQMVSGVPNYFGNVMLNHQFSPNYSLLTHVYVKGNQLAAASNPGGNISSYALLNTTLLAKNLVKDLSLSASVYNWLDKDYQDPALYLRGNYPNPGRSVFIRAEYKF